VAELRSRRSVPASALLVASIGSGFFFGCDDGVTTAPDVVGKVEASEWFCGSLNCVQRHVRLPDDGEWRCAEEDGVAWCAGGEPAAGVVRAPAERGYVCGVRRVRERGVVERVCVDESPDIPGTDRERYRCEFAQEQGMKRECYDGATEVRPVVARTAPDCWIDADCAPGTCDRGRCAKEAP
jgi:hypothetical protein